MSTRLRDGLTHRLLIALCAAELLVVGALAHAAEPMTSEPVMPTPDMRAPLPLQEALSWPLPDHDSAKALGNVTCASSTCHGSIKPWKNSHVLQNEYVTWTHLDKHARSLEVLANERSRKIAQKLGIGDPMRAKICLDCHTDNRAEATRGPRYDPADGIGCEACHGAAENYISSHVAPGATHADNLAHGMYPVDDAAARARLCLSCHFGNRDKLVTHRIMGAGHPRISFELETYSMIEPAHFRLRSDDAQHTLLFDGARIWAVGQAIDVENRMDILLDVKRNHDGIFPELVLFDCHACHHPMSDLRWSQRTAFGPSLSPGVVRLNDSSMLMMAAFAHQLDPALGERVRNAAAALEAATAGQGDLVPAAQTMKTLAMDVAQRIARTPFDRAMLYGTTLTLIDEGLAGNYVDYAGAEQMTMAISSLLDFGSREGWLENGANINAQISGLDSLLANDEHYPREQFQNRLKTLRATLTRQS